MRKQFRDTIVDLNDDKITLILGDVSVYLFDESTKNPNQVFNLSIGENSLVSISAGLSSQGLIPFIHTINPFLSDRSFEQIKLDLIYNDYPTNIVTCGGTFDYGFDGVSHHSYSDLSNLRLLPNIEILHLGSEKEVDKLVRANIITIRQPTLDYQIFHMRLMLRLNSEKV